MLDLYQRLFHGHELGADEFVISADEKTSIQARCRGLLPHADREPQSPRQWEQWLTATRKAIRKHAVATWGAGTPDERAPTRLIHTHCHRRINGGGDRTALPPARKPSGLA